jgi:hypothetical protein
MDHLEYDASKYASILAGVFIAAVMFLLSRCVATIDTNTDGRDL